MLAECSANGRAQAFHGDESDNGDESYVDFSLPASRHSIRIYNIPFPAIAYTPEGLVRSPEAFVDGARPYLMSFGGSLAGTEESMRLRKKIFDACRKYDEPLCTTSTSAHRGTAVYPAEKLALAFELKRRSVFCLEPGGFNVIRKAIFDSLALGCIPVLFVESYEVAQLWPWHWGSWRNQSSVIIPRGERPPSPDIARRSQQPTRAVPVLSCPVTAGAYIAGEVDLLETLQAIPAAQVARMQATIVQNVPRVMHFDSPTEFPDALDVTLAAFASWREIADTIEHV